jgi:cyclophilin family peptidyl-prolyl cis-trans isomerase
MKVPMMRMSPTTSLFGITLAAAALLTSCGGSGSNNDNYVAPQVTMTVSNGAGVSGDIVITLASLQAPVTTANFLAYVNSGFYNGLIFHRHSPSFVLQGGGYAGPVVANTTPLPALKLGNAPIALEDGSGLLNQKFTVAMTGSNSPGSATSQFVINLADNPSRDRTFFTPGYAVFGAITAGSDVLAAMAAAPCSSWVGFFGRNRDGTPIDDCLPSPNLVIVSARQTR